MPPHAICSSSTCAFSLELQDMRTGTLTETPARCPVCQSPMISLCPLCRFLLLDIDGSKSPNCGLCGADLKLAFTERSNHPYSVQTKRSNRLQ
jgi:hypothetical protein